jgi:hypothetical protein
VATGRETKQNQRVNRHKKAQLEVETGVNIFSFCTRWDLLGAAAGREKGRTNLLMRPWSIAPLS